jgi:hypothetical protein
VDRGNIAAGERLLVEGLERLGTSSQHGYWLATRVAVSVGSIKPD